MLEAYVSYPGLKEEVIESFSYTMGHGIQPGVFTFSILPQDMASVALSGDLRLSYGSTRITFVDCLADSASYSYDTNGEVIGFMLRDFRWKWEFSYISGAYNVMGQNGKIIELIKETDKDAVGYPRRSLKKLAELCLKAMGVSSYDISRVPDAVYPPVEWDNIIAARALDELLQPFDLRICPTPNEHVLIAKIGRGERLPNNNLIDSLGEEFDPPTLPRELIVTASPTMFHAEFPLEAVGLDTNGIIKPIDTLSYTPASGWNVVSANGSFWSISGTALAKKTVFKWWRIKVPTSIDNFNGELKHIEQFLPLLDSQADLKFDIDSKTLQRREPIVWGKFVGGDSDLANNLSCLSISDVDPETLETSQAGKKAVMAKAFTIDYARGIVMFDDPVDSIESATSFTWELPDLFLRIGVFIRDLQTGMPVHHSVRQVVSRKSLAKEMRVHVPEAQLTYGLMTKDNKSETESLLNEYGRDIIEAMGEQTGASASYVGIIPIILDGAIRSVTWSFNESGAMTSATVNTDRSSSQSSLGYRQRQRVIAAKRAVSDATELRAKNLRGLTEMTKRRMR